MGAGCQARFLSWPIALNARSGTAYHYHTHARHSGRRSTGQGMGWPAGRRLAGRLTGTLAVSFVVGARTARTHARTRTGMVEGGLDNNSPACADQRPVFLPTVDPVTNHRLSTGRYTRTPFSARDSVHEPRAPVGIAGAKRRASR